MKSYDIVIIGSGAGLMILESAIANGAKCAIVEKSKFGGTCLTKGCIPSKMLVYPADLIRESESSDKVGISFKKPDIDWEKISSRTWEQIDYSKTMEHQLKHFENLDVYNGVAEFTGSKTIKVRKNDGEYTEEFEGSKIIIANGARSFIPPIKDIEDTGYVIPETFFGEKYPKKPWKSLIVVGGGAIGAEFAHIFSAFGTKVTIVEMRPRILATEEEEISSFVETQFKNNGITVLTNSKIVASAKNRKNKTLTLENMTTGASSTIEAEEIFLASGVRSNSDTLHLENTAVEVDARGWIKTNELLETTQKDIYAIGDINGKYQFRHKANYEAEILTYNLFAGGEKRKACYNAVPWAIFTWPQVAHVGMTEAEARSYDLKCWVGRNYFSHIAGGIAMGFSEGDEDVGFVKIIAGEDKKILGVHVVGPQAAILVQPFVYLMNAGHKCEQQRILNKDRKVLCPPLGSITPINDSMVIHPSLNELTAWAIDNINWEDEG